MSGAPDAIRALHRAYVQLTGLDVGLNMDRERVWWDWLHYRTDDPFTAADLRLVIDYLRTGIRNEQRNAGCLRFRNLVGNPDYFDEERAAARKARATANKPRPPAIINQPVTSPAGVTNRLQPNPGTQDTSEPVKVALENILSTEGYKQWKKDTFGT